VEIAFFRFLGMPRFLFLELAEQCRQHLPQYDKSIQRRGQPTKLDHIDVVAVALRYTLLMSVDYLEQLCIFFGRNASVVGRAVSDGMDALLTVLRTIKDAAIRYPTLEEAEKQWGGMMAQYGKPPWDPTIRAVLFTDGTFTPALNPTNKAEQTLLKGPKGVGFNNVLTMTADGCVADAVIAKWACYNDARISTPILDRHWGPRCSTVTSWACSWTMAGARRRSSLTAAYGLSACAP
jgi:predicted NBD/HSP70 family sugar kinase